MEILFQNCNILDGTKDMVLKEEYDILVSDGYIVKIDKKLKTKGKTIDMKGAYVTPGLINLHVHIPGSGKPSKKKVADQGKLIDFIKNNKLGNKIGLALCKKYVKGELYSGTTTIRSVGGIGDLDTRLRDLIQSGKATGPRIYAANTAIGVPNGHMDHTVAMGFENVEDATKQVDVLKREGVDLIKLMITGGVLDAKEVGHPGVLKMNQDMVQAVCSRAHELGLKVAAHVEGPEGFKIALENGVDTIEHGAMVEDSLISIMKKENKALVCTLSPAIPLSKVPSSIMGYGENAIINTNVLLDGMISTTEKCLRNNVLVGLGTDTGCPYVTHTDMYRELIYFTKYISGATPNLAIHTATLVNAKILGEEKKIGSIEEGKLADFFFMKENPLKNLSTMASPLLVVKNGKIYKKKNKKNKRVEQILNQYCM